MIQFSGHLVEERGRYEGLKLEKIKEKEKKPRIRRDSVTPARVWALITHCVIDKMESGLKEKCRW